MYKGLITLTKTIDGSSAIKVYHCPNFNKTVISLEIKDLEIWSKEMLDIKIASIDIIDKTILIKTQDKRQISLSLSGEVIGLEGFNKHHSNEEIKTFVLSVFNNSNKHRKFDSCYLTYKNNTIMLDSHSEITQEKMLIGLLNIIEDVGLGAMLGYRIRTDKTGYMSVVFTKEFTSPDRWSSEVYD